VILLMGNVAQACPKHHQAANPAKIEHVSASKAVQWAAPSAIEIAVPSRAASCGAGCHCFGCSGGCCSMGSTVVDVSRWVCALPSASTSLAMLDQGEVSSLKPPPNDRPPCAA